MTSTRTIESKDLSADLVRDNAQMPPIMGEAAARPASIGEPSHGGELHGVMPLVDTLLSSSAAGTSIVAGQERTFVGEAKAMLEAGQLDVIDALTRRLEKVILKAALGVTRRRRVEVITRLGTGCNTITYKLQELGFD